MSKRVKITTPSGDIYRFDAVFNQNTNDMLTLTTYPVQDGTPITEHAYKDPETVTLRVAVSDIRLNGSEGSFDSGEEANAILESWQKDVLLLKIQTKFKLYENMVLVGKTITTNSNNSNVLDAQLSFRKIRIASIEEVVAGPFASEESAAYESPYQNSGSVQGTEVVDEIIEVAGDTIGGVVAGAAVGAAIGGIVGSIIPGAGTVAGAILGAKIGAIVGGSFNFLKSTFGGD